MKQNEEKADLDIVESNNQDREKDITMASNPIIVNSKSLNTFKCIPFYLNKSRIFAPDFELIDSTFTSPFSRFFLKRCVEISVENPGLKRLKPAYGLPDDEDIEKIKTFLYLYNATLKKEYNITGTAQGFPVYTFSNYYIELYDDPE